jgi:hypothetical protein
MNSIKNEFLWQNAAIALLICQFLKHNSDYTFHAFLDLHCPKMARNHTPLYTTSQKLHTRPTHKDPATVSAKEKIQQNSLSKAR